MQAPKRSESVRDLLSKERATQRSSSHGDKGKAIPVREIFVDTWASTNNTTKISNESRGPVWIMLIEEGNRGCARSTATLKTGKHEESEGRQAEERSTTKGAKSSLAKLKMKFERNNRHVNHARRSKGGDGRVDIMSVNNHARVQCRKLIILRISVNKEAIVDHQAMQIYSL